MQGRSGRPRGGPHHPFVISHISTWASLTRALPPKTQSPKFQFSPPTLDISPLTNVPNHRTGSHKSALQPEGGSHHYVYFRPFMSPTTPGPRPPAPPSPTHSHAWPGPEGLQLPAGFAAGACSQGLPGKVLQVGFASTLIKKARRGE